MKQQPVGLQPELDRPMELTLNRLLVLRMVLDQVKDRAELRGRALQATWSASGVVVTGTYRKGEEP